VVDQMVDEIDRFHRALDRYREQRWDEADNLLITLNQADPNRKAYKLYLERVANLRTKPPGKDWDGVFTFTTK
jgi:adenylate cyclase